MRFCVRRVTEAGDGRPLHVSDRGGPGDSGHRHLFALQPFLPPLEISNYYFSVPFPNMDCALSRFISFFLCLGKAI